MWKFFEQSAEKVTCMICRKDFAKAKTGNTSNLKKHLLVHHKKEYYCSMDESEEKQQEFNRTVVAPAVSKAKVKTAGFAYSGGWQLNRPTASDSTVDNAVAITLLSDSDNPPEADSDTEAEQMDVVSPNTSKAMMPLATSTQISHRQSQLSTGLSPCTKSIPTATSNSFIILH